MDKETLSLLDFPRLLQVIQGFTQCSLGANLIREVAPGQTRDQVVEQLRQVEESMRWRSAGGRADFRNLEDPLDLINRVYAGEVLEPKDLLQILELLQSARLLKSSFKSDDWPVLARVVEPIPVLDPLLREIERVVDPSGEIKESADPELAQARRRQSHFRTQIQDHLHTFFGGTKAKFLIQDPYVTLRNGRYVIPVKVEHQRDLPGVVHGTSSSGATLFVEPFTAVDLNNQYLYYEDREREIIARVLRRLSEQLRASSGVLRQAAQVVGRMDLLLACAEFGDRYRCIVPELVDDQDLRFESARHPLLISSLGFDKVVPISVDLGTDSQVLVISGPNTGGKTVALKTVGLIASMAAAGLPVPAAHARLPFFHSILADIGDHQSLAEQLSTFSAHILRIKTMMERIKSPALVLLDEVGAGTDPVHGSALGVALIDHFRRKGCLVVATTHHQAIKQFAFSATGVKNASVELNPVTLRPTYELRIGVAGGSSGLEIASQLGIDRQVIEQAKSLLTEQELQAERYLASLRAEIQASHEQRQLLREEVERLQQEEGRRRIEAERRERERQEQFEKTVEQWARKFTSESEHWIKTVKDRFEAARLRKERKQKEAILKEEFRRKMVAGAQAASGGSPPEELQRPGSLEIGAIVFHSFFRKQGRVVALDGDQAVLEIDGKRVPSRLDQLQKPPEVPEEKKLPARVLPQNVTLQVVEEAEYELNLVGRTVEEALGMADKFLDRAFVASLRQVRIIHGFGKGKLKQALSSFLDQHPHVQEHQVEGGATVVSIRP